MITSAIPALAPTAVASEGAGSSDTENSMYVIDTLSIGLPDTVRAGKNDTFVNNGTRVVIDVLVRNTGPDAVGTFPIMAYEVDAITAGSQEAKLSRDCRAFEHVASGESFHAKLEIRLTRTTSVEDAFRNVTVLVNRNHNTIQNQFEPDRCASANTGRDPELGVQNPPRPFGATGAQAKRPLIVDYKMDLRARDFHVCTTDATPRCWEPGEESTLNLSHSSADEFEFRFKLANERPANVANVNWLNTSNYTTGPAFDSHWKIPYRIVYSNANATEVTGTLEGVAEALDENGNAAGFHEIDVTHRFPLYGAAGDYSFTLEVDPANAFREIDEEDNAATTQVHVRAPDLAGAVGFTGLGSTPEAPFSYDADGEFRFKATVTLENLGDYVADNGTEIPFELYLIRPDPNPDLERSRIENATPVWTNADEDVPNLKAAGEDGHNWSHEFDFVAINDPERDGYIPQGTNKLVLLVDPPAEKGERGAILESNEANNRMDFLFYVEDTEAPKLSDFTLEIGDPMPDYVTADASGSTTVREGMPLVWRVHVDEADAGASIQVHITNTTSGNVTKLNMSRILPEADDSCGDTVVPPCRGETHELNMTTGILDAGDYEVQVRVEDSAGESAVLPGVGFDIRVEKWPIQTVTEDEIIHQVTRGGVTGAEIDFENGQEFEHRSAGPTFHIRVNDNETRGYWTGYSENSKDNKEIRHALCEPEVPCDPANLTFKKVHDNAPGQDTRYECGRTLPDRVLGNDVQNCDYSHWTFTADTGNVGTHYYQFVITDIAGKSRTIERWYTVTGYIPEFVDVRLPTSVDLTGEDQWFQVAAHVKTSVNTSDEDASDFAIAGVKAHFRHERSGYTFEKDLALVNETGPVFEGNWTGNITVGWLNDLTHVGRYNVTLIAQNKNGATSNNTTLLSIGEQDDSSPHIRHAGTEPRIQQEITLPVKFYVNATDRDFWWAELVVKRGNEEVLRTPMVRDANDPWNLTYEWNATGTPGAYSYTIVAKDSNAPDNRTDQFDGAITLVQNLPPRFIIESPSFMSEDTGDRFGGPRPKIQVLITDKDGILANTIRLRVNDENVTLTEQHLEAVEDPRGVRVTYTFPAGQDPFAHNETVTLNMSAQEANENDKHYGYLSEADQSFRVDALAPRSSPPILEGPFWSELDTDAKNVSLSTVIRLTGEENADGAHTDVKSMRYRVLRTDASRWVTLTPGDAFTFQELFDRGIIDYVGSSPYKIEYYATDAVDNAESQHSSLDVVLDDLPPFMDGLASRLRGPEINTTWTDEHAGVNRVAAMARVNDGIYQPVALEESAGVWSTVLDLGEKGDRVCYYVQAWDNVENVGTHGSPEEPAVCYEVGNSEPTLAITSPGAQAVVNGNVRIEWTALDPDGDDLTFKIYYRLNGRQNFVELASLPADSSSYALDSRSLADGTYDIQVTATDGSAVVFENVQVTIMNAAAVVEDPKVSRATVRPGESVLLTAIVNKADANVEARVYRAGSGTVVQNVTMHDDGQNGDEAPGDGVYSALVTFEGGGTYDVEIFARYTENGQIKEATLSDAGQFTVKLTAADVFSTFAGLWVALVALAVACVGVGGYALFRRWRA